MSSCFCHFPTQFVHGCSSSEDVTPAMRGQPTRLSRNYQRRNDFPIPFPIYIQLFSLFFKECRTIFQCLTEKHEKTPNFWAFHLSSFSYLVIYLYIREHTSKCSGLVSSALFRDFKYFPSFLNHIGLESLDSTSKT